MIRNTFLIIIHNKVYSKKNLHHSSVDPDNPRNKLDIKVLFDIFELSVPLIVYGFCFSSHSIIDYTCQDCDEEAE